MSAFLAPSDPEHIYDIWITRERIHSTAPTHYIVPRVCASVLVLTLLRCREDRPDLRIPKSFAQLKALNLLLKKYRDIYPVRIVICYVTTYLL